MRGLECLVTVTEQGSLTKAAAVLHLSQPALSHQIAAIERELGTPVFERLARGIRPTAAGLAAVAEARVALAAADKAVSAARRAAAGAGGRVTIACAENMTGWLLAPAIPGWRRRFPDVELDLREYAGTDRMPDALLADDTDIAVTPAFRKADERAEVLGAEEILVVAPSSHRFAAMDAVSLSELGDEPLVHYERDVANARWAEEFAMARGVRLPRAAVRAGSPRAAAQLAAAGAGVAIVPASALAPGLDATIRSLDPPGLRDVVVIAAAPHDDLVRRFVRHLKRHGLPHRPVPAKE